MPKETVESQLFNDLNFQKEKISAAPPLPTIKAEPERVVLVEPSESFKPAEHIKPLEPLAPINDDKTIQRIIKRKEETQHRYLQNLIKKMAEARGYKATIEAAIANEKGKVDVLLEKEKQTIACEVSVTTDAAWEIHNIQKCLAARYDTVVSCQPDHKGILQLQKKAADVFSKEEMSKIKFFSPENFFSYLDEITVASMETETMIKGYRVRVSYDAISPEDMEKKRQSVAKVIADSLRKLKKE